MGITRAQIARQLLAEGGKIGNTTFQLARKRPDGKKPGYFGPDAGEGGMESDFGQDTYSTSNVDFGGVSGGTDQQFADARSAIEARTPKETLGQKIVNQIKKLGKYSPTLNTLKGIGGFFGGAFDKLANLRGFNPNGTRRTQAQFERARDIRRAEKSIANIMGRNAPFTDLTLDRLAGLYSVLGQNVPGNINESLIGTTNVTRSGTSDQNFPDRVEGIVSQARGNPTFRDAMAQLNLERGVPRDQQFLTEAQKNYIDENKTISSEDLGTVQQNIKDATGYDTTLAGLNQKQVDYLNKIDRMNKKVGNTGLSTMNKSLRFPDQQAGAFFEYKSPQEVLDTVMGLNEASTGLFSDKVDPDKNVYGDINTFAQPDEITNYIQSLSPEDRTYSFGIPKNEPGKNYLELFKGGFIK